MPFYGNHTIYGIGTIYGSNYSLDYLIKNPVKRPIRRVYIKRRDNITGLYETNWKRIDLKDGVNKIINHGQVVFKIDSDKLTPNNFDIASYSCKIMNDTGNFNSSTDPRSLWSGYRDYKDTKLKVEVALFDPDLIEIGTITAFEGVIQSVDTKGDNTATIKALSYAKKLNEVPFLELVVSGNQTVSYILNAIFSNVEVLKYFPVANVTISPTNNPTINCTANEKLTGSCWEVIKYLAMKSNSTISIMNDTFFFGTREVVSTVANITFAGLGNTQPGRVVTIYGKPSYDQSGADKLFTKCVDTTANLIGDYSWIDDNTLEEGKTLELDLSDFTSSPEKQALLNSYTLRYGKRRPSLEFNCPFMMFTLFPLDVIAFDNPGARTEINSGYWDSSLYDDIFVWDGAGASASISKDDRFIIESITYDIDKWESKIFARKQV